MLDREKFDQELLDLLSSHEVTQFVYIMRVGEHLKCSGVGATSWEAAGIKPMVDAILRGLNEDQEKINQVMIEELARVRKLAEAILGSTDMN